MKIVPRKSRDKREGSSLFLPTPVDTDIPSKEDERGAAMRGARGNVASMG